MRAPITARRPLRRRSSITMTQPLRPLADTDHAHVGQADQQRAHARTIRFQAGAPETRRRRTPPRIAEPLCRARDLAYLTTSSHPQIRSASNRVPEYAASSNAG